MLFNSNSKGTDHMQTIWMQTEWMMGNESCENQQIDSISRWHSLFGFLYVTLELSHILLLMQFIKVKNPPKLDKFAFIFSVFSHWLFSFHFSIWLYFAVNFVALHLTKQKRRKMPCDNRRIFIMPLHTSKSTLDNCIVWFGNYCCCCGCSWLCFTCVHTKFEAFVTGRKKIPSERKK